MQGFGDFQNTASEGICKNLLQWKGVEVIEKIIEFGTAKTVTVGAGDDGVAVSLSTN